MRTGRCNAALGLLEDTIVALDWNSTDRDYMGFPVPRNGIRAPEGFLAAWWNVSSKAVGETGNLNSYIRVYLEERTFDEAVKGLNDETNSFDVPTALKGKFLQWWELSGQSCETSCVPGSVKIV